MKSVENFLDSLGEEDAKHVKQKCIRGIALVTDYSGSGQPEHAMKRLLAHLANDGTDVKFEDMRASDCDECCREVLCEMCDEASLHRLKQRQIAELKHTRAKFVQVCWVRVHPRTGWWLRAWGL
jgi:hypothetical protein